MTERFSYAEIRDTIIQLCAASSERIPKWLLSVMRAQLADEYAHGRAAHGEPIEVVDRQRERVMGPATEWLGSRHACGARPTLQAVVDRE